MFTTGGFRSCDVPSDNINDTRHLLSQSLHASRCITPYSTNMILCRRTFQSCDHMLNGRKHNGREKYHRKLHVYRITVILGISSKSRIQDPGTRTSSRTPHKLHPGLTGASRSNSRSRTYRVGTVLGPAIPRG